ncbi:MAG: prenyltransferase [Candidatus Bathyarchaeota archaeon]|nr:prenyltransferase [Candidatus Bathyarchaeota archaeon]
MGYLLAVLGGVGFDLGKFVSGYLILGLAQLSVSFSNDYFDRYSDRNSTKTAFSGGSKVLVEHPELEGLALKTAIFFLATSMIATAFFTFAHSYSYWFLVFGISGGLVGWFYSAPPLMLAYRGLGELTTVLAVGVMMPGIGYFAASGLIDYSFLVFVFPLSCYGLFFILAVELPDVETDRIANKTNIVVKWGRKAGTYISVTATILGTVFLAAIHLSGILDGKPNLEWITLLSVMPIVAAITAIQESAERRNVLRQVTISMTTMILFISIVDIILLFQFLR